MARTRTALYVGTRKGAFIAESEDRRRWRLRGPFFRGYPTFDIELDPRDGRTIYAAVNSEHWGPMVHRSRDGGRSWKRASSPPHFAPEDKLSVERIWQVAPGPPDEPEQVYAGVDPAGLFRSDDGGATWSAVEGLNRHRTRSRWQPGGGGLCLHTILPHPKDPREVTVGISAGGIFTTRDAGENWVPEGQGIRADFLPSKFPEVGHCPHKIARDARQPARLFQQHHNRVYKREDGEARWKDINRGLPTRYGFALATHGTEGNTAYVIPLAEDRFRSVPDGRVIVYRTRDGGRRWSPLRRGLPQKAAYLSVYRDGLATDAEDPGGVYFGTSTGQLFGSRDDGESWQLIAQWLPPILSVSAGSPGRT